MMHALPITYMECEAIYTRLAGLRSILFASVAVGEGNSTIAYAIAQRAAAGGNSVLYLDLNTRQSFPRDQLGLPASSWSLDKGIPEEAFVPLGDQQLVMLPAPVERSFGIEGRQRRHLGDLLDRLKNRFDLVIADAPPVTSLSEAGLATENVANLFDGVVLTTASASTPASEVKRASEKLKAGSAHLLGCVLNDRANPDLRSELQRQFDKLGRLGRVAGNIVMPLFDRLLVNDMHF